MRRRTEGARRTVAMALLLLMAAGGARAQGELDAWQVLAMDRAAFRIEGVALMPMGNEPGQTLLYGDRYGILHAIQMSARGAQEVWRSRTLEGPVLEVLVEDLDGNGTSEIVARTVGGRIYVFDDSFNSRWENLREDYDQISALELANMDEDPAFELVILADGLLDYVDGAQFNREFRSTQSYRGTDMAIGNVDTDLNLEIVLNTGTVVDALQGEPDWQTDPFGEFIELLDIDGDGLQEILGWSSTSQPVRVFDVDQQQEKPLQ